MKNKILVQRTTHKVVHCLYVGNPKRCCSRRRNKPRSGYWSFTTGDSGSVHGMFTEISPANEASKVAINTDMSCTSPPGIQIKYYVYHSTNNIIGNAANDNGREFWNGCDLQGRPMPSGIYLYICIQVPITKKR